MGSVGKFFSCVDGLSGRKKSERLEWLKNSKSVENPCFQTAQKGPRCEASTVSSAERRARERRAEAYLSGTSERGGRAQRSRWVFFNGLFKIIPR